MIGPYFLFRGQKREEAAKGHTKPFPFAPKMKGEQKAPDIAPAEVLIPGGVG
jgi:hypothetical protein